MKTIILRFSIIFLLFASFISCQPKTSTNIIVNDEDTFSYDSLKAAEYGADDYGMKKYVMAFLKSGPNQDLSKEERTSLQKAHLENIIRMADEGKLLLAGPFFGSGEIRGIYIFDVQSLQEAQELTSTDPAIQAGSLAMELKEWYGSAALKDLNKIHKRYQKKSIIE